MFRARNYIAISLHVIANNHYGQVADEAADHRGLQLLYDILDVYFGELNYIKCKCWFSNRFQLITDTLALTFPVKRKRDTPRPLSQTRSCFRQDTNQRARISN